jgi:hypothetical protein
MSGTYFQDDGPKEKRREKRIDASGAKKRKQTPDRGIISLLSLFFFYLLGPSTRLGI